MVPSVNNLTTSLNRVSSRPEIGPHADGMPRDTLEQPPAYSRCLNRETLTCRAPYPPEPKRPTSTFVTFNIGDRLTGSIPRGWLQREPNSKLARVLRREEPSAEDAAGRVYLDISTDDWKPIEQWLSQRMLNEPVTASLRATARAYGLESLTACINSKTTCKSSLSQHGATLNLHLANAATKFISGVSWTLFYTGKIRLSGCEKPVNFCTGDGHLWLSVGRTEGACLMKRHKRLTLQVIYGGQTHNATKTSTLVSERLFDCGLMDPRLMDPLSDIYNADASLDLTFRVTHNTLQG